MSKQSSADKRQAKALIKRDSALGTFTTAISEVGQANALLSEANDLDSNERGDIAYKMDKLKERSKELQERKNVRDSQIRDNNELIKRLREFTV